MCTIRHTKYFDCDPHTRDSWFWVRTTILLACIFIIRRNCVRANFTWKTSYAFLSSWCYKCERWGRGRWNFVSFCARKIWPIFWRTLILRACRCHRGSKIPSPPPGTKWKEVRHDNTVNLGMHPLSRSSVPFFPLCPFFLSSCKIFCSAVSSKLH